MAQALPSDPELLPETLGDSSDQILARARADSYRALHDLNKSPAQKAAAQPGIPAPSKAGAPPQTEGDTAIPATPLPAARGLASPTNLDPDLDAIDVPVGKSEDTPPNTVPVPEAEDKPSAWRKVAGVGYAALQGLGGNFNSLEGSLNKIAGVLPIMGDAIHSMFTVTPTTKMQDAWFRTMVDPTEEAAKSFATDDDASFGEKAAHAIGGTVGVISQAILTGGSSAAPAATTVGARLIAAAAHGTKVMLVPAASSAVEKGQQVLKQTNDPKQAVESAVTDYLLATASALVPLGVTGKLATRVVTGAVSGAAAGEASRQIQNKVDPGTMGQEMSLENLIIQAMQGAAMGGIAGQRPAAEAAPPTGAPPNTEDVPQAQSAPEPPPPAPAAPALAVAPKSAAPVQPVSAEPAQRQVADTPSAESSKDLQAQFEDAMNPKTPRQGVLVSKPSLEALKTDDTAEGSAVKAVVKSAQSTGRLVKTPNGDFLVMPTTEAAQKAEAELAKGTDPQVVIGRITGAGEGKAPDQTVVVQGQTPEGAVTKESMVTPAEVPAKIAEVKAEGKEPVVTTPVEAIARRERTVAEAQTPKRGLAMVGKEQLPVHIEEGAPEGMVRVRPLDEQGEPGQMTHDIPKEQVLTGEEAPKPVEKPAVTAPKPAAEAAESPLETALQQHEAQEQRQSGRAFAGKLSERQDNTSTFAGALETAAKTSKAAPEVVARAMKAAKAGIDMTNKSEGATAKGQGTGHSRITAINDEMHRAARQMIGKARPGDEIPAVAPKAAALKARIERAKNPPPEPKVTSAAKQAEAEVRTKFPGVDNLSENVLAARMLKKRTAEIEAASAKAKTEAKEQMVEAPVNKEVEKTVSDEQLRKARNKAKTDEAQAKISEHPKHIEEAQKSAEAYAALKKQHDLEHGVVIEPDEPKTVAQELKVKNATKEHDKLVQDYINAKEDELPEAFDRVVQSAERLAGRKMDDKELADAKRIMDNQREITKLTQEQETDFDPKIRTAGSAADWLRSSNPLSRELAKLHDNLRTNGVHQKLEDIKRSGGTIGTHELLRHLVDAAPNPMMRGMLQGLLRHIPDIPVRPSNTVYDPNTGLSNPRYQGLFSHEWNSIEFAHDAGKPFSTESLIHEMVHAATVYELKANPNGQLATELGEVLEDIRRRAGREFGEDTVKEHIDYFQSGGKLPAPKNSIRDLYALTNVREMLAETFANPEFQKFLTRLDKGAMPAPGPTTFLGRIAKVISKFIGAQHATPLFERVMDLTHKVMEAQAANPAHTGVYGKGLRAHELDLPEGYQSHIVQDAMRETLTPEENEAIANIGEIPPNLPRGDAALKDIVGDEAMDRIRSFSHIAREGVFKTARILKMSNTSYDQLVRRYRGDFGHEDDPNNPMTQYESAADGKAKIRHDMQDRATPIAEAWRRLPPSVDKQLGQLQIDSTTWGIDPSKPKDSQATSSSHMRDFDKHYDEFARRWDNLPADAKKVFTDVRDYFQWSARRSHYAGVDTALSAYDMRNIGPAQRSLLYGVKNPAEYDDLIGSGKLIDVGESNEPVKAMLKSMAGLTKLDGIYFPLARHGDYVVHANPEATKAFESQAQAEAFASKVRQLSPGSKANVRNLAGKWSVDYKAEYTSFHRTKESAQTDAMRMREMGLDIGHVTQKTYGEDTVPMTAGVKQLVAEATRQINKSGVDAGSAAALVENLRGAFLRMMANRSAYSASRLARKSVAGVKPEEMQRNFAQHVESTASHVASLKSVFKEAEALGKLRAAARDQHAAVSQNTMYRRGAVVEQIGKRLAQSARQLGSKVWGNSFMAKLGYSNFLFSPAHAIVNLTQNFTTAIPYASARFGTGKSVMAFARSMKLVAGPVFRTTFLAHIRPNELNGRSVLNAVLEAIRKDPVHGKWARGDNSHIQQLMDKGAITSTFSNELADIAKGDNPFWGSVFEYARLLPHLSDVFNRTTTALAALELTRGDVRATADMVNSTHVNYSLENAPRAFRAMKQVPIFGTSIVMFKTYMQGMAHLLYSNIRDSIMGARHVEGTFMQKRAQAMKTVAALGLGTALFTGLKGATPELVHLAVYVYNKIFGDKDEYWDFNNAMHRALGETLGDKAGDLVFSGLPHAAGVDVSNRMGFNELFLHNPPDLLDMDKDRFNQFVVDQLGTVPGLTSTNLLDAYHEISNGNVAAGLEKAVPIKIFQSVMSAFHEYEGGNTHAGGQMMVEPGNTYGAAMQAIGLKPVGLAQAQEKQNNAIEYRNFIDDHKKAVVKDLVDNGMNMSKIADWNSKHPDRGDRISAQDIVKMRQQKMMAEQRVSGMPDRNSKVRELNDFGN